MTMTALAAARHAYLDAVDVYTADKTLANRDAAIAAGKAYTDAMIAAGGDPTNDSLTEDDFFTNPVVMTAGRRRVVKSAFGIQFPMVWRFVTTEANQAVMVNTKAGSNVTIDWGDGAVDSTVTADNPTHTYTTPGVYDVAISGHILGFNSPGIDTTLTEVVQWGSSIDIDGYNYMFSGRQGLISTPTDEAPKFKPGTTLYYMFWSAENFNSPLNHWDMTNITAVSSMFLHAGSFNQPLDQWDVSGIINMYRMFGYAHAFNQDIGGWNVSNVANMKEMFYQSTDFNQDISSWDVSSVTTMESMFSQATTFNQDISGWNVTNVTANTNFAANSALTAQNNPFS